MRPICNLLAAVLIATGFISCKKNDTKSRPMASLNVVNAVIAGGAVKLNMNYRDSAKAYNAKSFGLTTSDGTIRLYSTSDSLKPYYLQQHDLKDGGTYSMFLFGGAESPESLMVEENIPAPYADSSFGIRVINLASGSGPLNITRLVDTTSNLFSEIAYKQLTEIVNLPLPFITTAAADSTKRKAIHFQVRDANGVKLATYELPSSVNSTYPGISINLQRFKNITLVIKGIAGETTGPDAFGVFPVAMSY